eukprot:Awhi_evm1s10120
MCKTYVSSLDDKGKKITEQFRESIQVFCNKFVKNHFLGIACSTLSTSITIPVDLALKQFGKLCETAKICDKSPHHLPIQ